MFGRYKCPYCGGKLHIVRTSPVVQYGCYKCMKQAEYLLSKGLSRREVEKIIRRQIMTVEEIKFAISEVSESLEANEEELKEERVMYGIVDLTQATRENVAILRTCLKALESELERVGKNIVDLPCKIGDEIFVIRPKAYPTEERTKIFKGVVEQIYIDENGWYIKSTLQVRYSTKSIGKTVFFTKEEAEKALKERA